MPSITYSQTLIGKYPSLEDLYNRNLDDYTYDLDAHSVQVIFPMEEGVDWVSISEESGSVAPGGSQVIDVTKLENTGKVIFGSTVDLRDLDSDKLLTYRIVGEDEADVKENLISVGSPIARALIGKEEGELIIVHAPGGEREYEVEKVQLI